MLGISSSLTAQRLGGGRASWGANCLFQRRSAAPSAAHQCSLLTSPSLKRPSRRRAAVVVASSAASASDSFLPEKTQFEKVTEVLTTLFPVWVCLGAGLGIQSPESFAWLKTEIFTYALGFLMLSMGLTLKLEDFKKCMESPVPILVGYLAQYIVKPALGYTIARFLNLSPPLATGLILVSCCPGGQASNVTTYIAHGDVALRSPPSQDGDEGNIKIPTSRHMLRTSVVALFSVLMTTASTIGAIVFTPLLTNLLAGTYVAVDAMGLASDTFKVVLVPTVLGVLVNEKLPGVVKALKPILPLVGVALTTLLCAAPCAKIATILKQQLVALCLPVGLLHVAAFAMGYLICKSLGFNEKTSRTVSIETGMQSAALGFLLAQNNFADPLVAVPSAVSVVFMALGGSGLAVYWRGKPTTD